MTTTTGLLSLGTLADLRRLLSTFTGRDRALLVVYVIAQFVVSLLDLVGLALMLPLMDVLLGADITEGYLGVINEAFGSPPRQQFVVMMAAFMVLAFTAKAVSGLGLQWWSSGQVIRLQVRTASRLLTIYLAEDYLAHRQRDTAELIRTIDGAVSDAHNKVLGGVLSLIASGLSIITIFAFLVAVMPVPTLAAAAYFGAVVFAMQRFLAGRNRRAGAQLLASGQARSRAIIDAMQGFREVRMHDAQTHFVAAYDRANQVNSFASRKANLYFNIPKYTLELMGVTGIAVLLSVVALSGQAAAIVPTMGLFVAATVKLLPTMSALTATLGIVRNGTAGLHIAVEALQRASQVRIEVDGRTAAAASATSSALPIEIDHLSFRYPDGTQDVLSDVCLSIPPGTSLALCGASGSGKTTLVDIVLGLIRTDRGAVTYGGHLAGEVDGWHSLVAYVPQDVYLLHSTLAANVAFGDAPEDWDLPRIHEALDRAQLTDLLEQLPNGLDSELGERGSRISGGQRQRIGIARALYRRPKVIVLDEATSALDNETEDRISRTIKSLRGSITTIIVAHRLSTVRDTDQLAFLEDGRIAAIGSFSEVRDHSAAFAQMVELGRLDPEHEPPRSTARPSRAAQPNGFMEAPLHTGSDLEANPDGEAAMV